MPVLLVVQCYSDTVSLSVLQYSLAVQCTVLEYSAGMNPNWLRRYGVHVVSMIYSSTTMRAGICAPVAIG
jgi:hypothetical protein